MLQDGQSGDFFSFFMCVLQIVQRYDVILIQEVRDGDLSATQKLMEYVNKYVHTPNMEHSE